ncbi:hypothetical protein SAMN04488692_1632 [Halarsenatibacter silvermanii]|uniref:HepT-like domain-containing protein n=1 Tax=Halarsenatibacter silvermanii TaxID=321763 RepID=A0A1G9U877_9FIRM|nr:hypothetical protein SAMN04488692_1632 [Halarsenatibacter silvermanii]
MQEKIEILRAEIKEDLESIKEIKSEFDDFIDHIDWENPKDNEQVIIGYKLHNFYNACENIFKNIARFFENVAENNEWHKKLLKRMKMEIEGVRPAVISHELYLILDDFRAFRHVFRHLYDGKLDWQKQKIVVDKFDRAANMMIEELEEFCDKLKEMA